jgi:hypothetical protein
LSTIAQAAGQYQVATVVGLPLEVIEKLYNCAAFQGDHAVSRPPMSCILDTL